MRKNMHVTSVLIYCFELILDSLLAQRRMYLGTMRVIWGVKSFVHNFDCQYYGGQDKVCECAVCFAIVFKQCPIVTFTNVSLY